MIFRAIGVVVIATLIGIGVKWALDNIRLRERADAMDQDLARKGVEIRSAAPQEVIPVQIQPIRLAVGVNRFADLGLQGFDMGEESDAVHGLVPCLF